MIMQFFKDLFGKESYVEKLQRETAELNKRTEEIKAENERLTIHEAYKEIIYDSNIN